MTWDPVWDEVFQQFEWGKYPSEDLIRFIARNYYQVPMRNNVRILEVGCGPGANLWYMAREGFKIYGIDGSETGIERARKRLDHEVPNWSGDLRVGDFTCLPYEDLFFDAVIDNEAIYCNSFLESQQIYSELARVTKPGGKLYSRTFAIGCWGYQTGQKVGHNTWVVSEGPNKNKGYCRFTDYDDIPQLIKDFEISNIELLTRTQENGQHQIKEWIIIGEKL